MGKTKIEWASNSWNPLRALLIEPVSRPDPDNKLKILATKQRWGYHCEHASPGCLACYAEAINRRMLPYWGTGLAFSVPNRAKSTPYVDDKELRAPLRWTKPVTTFVGSMTDVFGEWVPDDHIDKLFAIAALSPRHRYLFLTKRAERMAEYWLTAPRERMEAILTEAVKISGIKFEQEAFFKLAYNPLPNVMLGTSVENQEWADKRLAPMWKLSQASWKTFVSYEPAIGPVLWGGWGFLNWMIIGGESGISARPFNLRWAYAALRHCRRSDTVPFMKQAGKRPYLASCSDPNCWADECAHADRQPGRLKFKDPKGGDMKEWPEWMRVREVPA